MLSLQVSVCIICKAAIDIHSPDICVSCQNALATIPNPCPRCGLSLPQGVMAEKCGNCRTMNWRVERCVALCCYDRTVSLLVQKFKYAAGLTEGYHLSQLLARKITHAYHPTELPQAIIPVPLHWRRSIERGFNQSNEIARVLSHRLNITYAPRLAKRLRATSPQAQLNIQARRRNVKGAFVCRAPLPHKIAIVDDVVTTGSTISALANCLANGGAQHIHLWCLGRRDAV